MLLVAPLSGLVWNRVWNLLKWPNRKPNGPVWARIWPNRTVLISLVWFQTEFESVWNQTSPTLVPTCPARHTPPPLCRTQVDTLKCVEYSHRASVEPPCQISTSNSHPPMRTTHPMPLSLCITRTDAYLCVRHRCPSQTPELCVQCILTCLYVSKTLPKNTRPLRIQPECTNVVFRHTTLTHPLCVIHKVRLPPPPLTHWVIPVNLMCLNTSNTCVKAMSTPMSIFDAFFLFTLTSCHFWPTGSSTYPNWVFIHSYG